MRQKSGNESLKALLGKCYANSFETVELCAMSPKQDAWVVDDKPAVVYECRDMGRVMRTKF